MAAHPAKPAEIVSVDAVLEVNQYLSCYRFLLFWFAVGASSSGPTRRSTPGYVWKARGKFAYYSCTTKYFVSSRSINWLLSDSPRLPSPRTTISNWRLSSLLHQRNSFVLPAWYIDLTPSSSSLSWSFIEQGSYWPHPAYNSSTHDSSNSRSVQSHRAQGNIKDPSQYFLFLPFLFWFFFFFFFSSNFSC